MAKQPTAPASTAGVGRVVAVVLAVPASVVVSLYRAEVFDPAAMPEDYSDHTASVPERHGRVLGVSERVGEGLLPGPEDMAYDAGSGFLYTGCDDGWIRRVKLPEGDDAATAEVEDWVQVGGRPRGLSFGPDQQLLVADAYKICALFSNPPSLLGDSPSASILPPSSKPPSHLSVLALAIEALSPRWVPLGHAGFLLSAYRE